MITRAAFLYERGGIVTGKSYPEVQAIGYRCGFTSGYMSGFVDDKGNFIDRNTALKEAIASGQLPENFAGPLTPEDLFGEDDVSY